MVVVLNGKREYRSQSGLVDRIVQVVNCFKYNFQVPGS